MWCRKYGRHSSEGGNPVFLATSVLLDSRFRGNDECLVRYFTHDRTLGNIEFIDFMPYDKLPVEINKADLCLGGHFSNKDKAKRVIPGKTFQFISCNKPTIVADNPANRELFRETRHLSFIEPGSPEKLASKILEIKNGR